ncbi:hypothetical protein P692DRAFT_20831142 [Suillus brevipes Sb2]|nr:hypothetical protein P692DRAFT_20831142 [Suillus brevipes Sb2]
MAIRAISPLLPLACCEAAILNPIGHRLRMTSHNPEFNKNIFTEHVLQIPTLWSLLLRHVNRVKKHAFTAPFLLPRSFTDSSLGLRFFTEASSWSCVL